MEKKIKEVKGELVVQSSMPLDHKTMGMPMIRKPQLVVEEAKLVAKEIKKVIDSKPKKVVINGKRYIEFDDWQMLGAPYGVTARVKETSEIYDKGDKKKFIGFLAKAVAVRDGTEISAAEAECLIFEPNWKRKAFNQRFMLRSMAQTRACSKALSNVLRWVVVLAGYEGTPAEEMMEGKSRLPDSIKKPIKRILKKKPAIRKKMKRFLSEMGADSLDDLDRSEGEELLVLISKL